MFTNNSLPNTFSTVKLLESKFKCLICEQTPADPHLLWCKHSFCKECILKKENCPLCGFKVTPQDIVPNIMFGRLMHVLDVASNLCNKSNYIEQPGTSTIKEMKESEKHPKDFLTGLPLEEKNKQVFQTNARFTECFKESNENSVPNKLNQIQKNSNNQTNSSFQTNSNKKNVSAKTPKLSKPTNSSFQTNSNKKNVSAKTPKLSKPTKELNKVNMKGETPLQISARQGKISKVQDLLSRGANPNVKDYAGWTPLCDAVGCGKIEVVQVLLKAGAGVNTPAHQNTTALVEAVVRKDKNMIKLLMSYGADMNQRTSLNNTALSIADEELKALLLSCNNHTIQPFPQVIAVPQVILMNKVSKKNAEKVAELCKTFNLALSSVFTEEISHIVVEVGEDKLCEESVELMQGLLKGCSVVGMDWVTACLAQEELLSVDEFEPTAVRGQPGSRVFTSARLNQEHLLPRLFDGCHVSLWHEQMWSTQLRQEVKMLATMGGAQFLPRACDAERIPLNEQTVMFHAPLTSPLAYTSHVVLYLPGLSEPQLKYNMVHIKTLPLDWFYRCINSFSILPPDL